MKKLSNYSYWVLTPALLFAFFVLTGGIMSSSSDYSTARPPTIKLFTHMPEQVFNNQQVTFFADVTANSSSSEYDSHDCSDDYSCEISRNLKSNIQISKNGKIVMSGEFEHRYEGSNGSGHYFDYTFLSPGTYEVFASFKTNWVSDSTLTDAERTSSTTMTLHVKDEGLNIAGTYQLTKFTAECSTGTKLEKTSGLGSTLVINDAGRAALNVNVTFSDEEREGRPCIGAGYDFSGSGQVQIIEKDDGSRFLRIQYQSNVHLEYGYSFDGTNLNLSYNDTHGNKYSFRFTKQ